MSFFSAELFARRHGGIRALLAFIEACNRSSLRQVAKAYGLSRSQVSRLRSRLLVCHWGPTPGTAQYIQWFIDNERQLNQDKLHELTAASHTPAQNPR